MKNEEGLKGASGKSEKGVPRFGNACLIIKRGTGKQGDPKKRRKRSDATQERKKEKKKGEGGSTLADPEKSLGEGLWVSFRQVLTAYANTTVGHRNESPLTAPCVAGIREPLGQGGYHE